MLGNGCLELGDAVLRNVVDGVDTEDSVQFGVAVAILGLVWVLRLAVHL